MKKYTVLFLAALLLLPAARAEAQNKVSSPDVTKGQIELEYRGSYDFDEQNSKDNLQAHKFVGNYGITDRWRMEFKADAAGRSSDMDWTYIEWSNRYQIFKDKEWWLKLSVQQNYKLSLVEGKPDKIEFSLLASKDTRSFTHITNVNFENEIGADAQGNTAFNLGWKTKYRWQSYLEPGFEAYADFGKFGESDATSPDKYFIGPALSGKLPAGIKYDAGFLFGLNKDVPDSRLRLIFSYAF